MRNVIWSKLLFALLVLESLLVGVVGVGPAEAAFPTTADAIRNWSPEFMASDHSYTKAEAVAIAKRFDVIAALTMSFKDYVGAMKTANPDLKILVYLNGAYAQSNEGSKYPDSWYARGASGSKVRSEGWGNYLMKVWRSDWVKDTGDRCIDLLAKSHYDGCLLDVLGTASVNPNYVTSLPINPATGRAWTEKDWLAETSALAAAVRSRIAPRFVVPNGIQWGISYFDPTAPSERLLSGSDGGMAEIFLRIADSSISAYPSSADWKRNVDMLVDAEAQGKSLFAVTKAWTSGTQGQKDAWHRFALASFLLGSNGRSYFSFLYDKNATRGHAWWGTNLGAPVAAYAFVDSVYQRSFKNGKVLVNPTTSTYTVSLGGKYIDLSGKSRTSVTLGPHTGAILTKA